MAGWQVEPLHAGLVGSFARGTADSESDIDVLLVRPEPLEGFEEDAWMDQLGRLDRRIRMWTGNAAQIIDLAPATLDQMAHDGDPLVDSWRAEDIQIHGERLLDLLRRLR